MTNAFLGKTLLVFALLHSMFQGQIFLLLQCLLTSYFWIPVPYNEKDIFWGCQSYKVFQGFTEQFNFSFFSVTSQGISLDYRDIEWSALETNRDHSVIFETASKYCIQTLLLTMMSTPFLLRDSCSSYHFMANRWGNNGNSERLYLLGSKITADGDCSHEIKR